MKQLILPDQNVTTEAKTPKGEDSVDGLFAEALRDAEEWGGALNDASWEMLDAYAAHVGEGMPVAVFNNGKAMLRQCILKFLAQVAKNAGANASVSYPTKEG